MIVLCLDPGSTFLFMCFVISFSPACGLCLCPDRSIFRPNPEAARGAGNSHRRWMVWLFSEQLPMKESLRTKFWATDKSAEGTLEACEKVCIVLLYQGNSGKKGNWRGFVIEEMANP